MRDHLEIKHMVAISLKNEFNRRLGKVHHCYLENGGEGKKMEDRRKR